VPQCLNGSDATVYSCIHNRKHAERKDNVIEREGQLRRSGLQKKIEPRVQQQRETQNTILLCAVVKEEHFSDI